MPVVSWKVQFLSFIHPDFSLCFMALGPRTVSSKLAAQYIIFIFVCKGSFIRHVLSTIEQRILEPKPFMGPIIPHYYREHTSHEIYRANVK
jgi:hypothetical protein